MVLQSTGIQPLPRKTAVFVSLSPRISAQLEILPGFNTQEYKVWWSRGKGCLQWLESTKMVSSCISHMIWGLDEVLTAFLHELCKRLLERCKYTEAQRDLLKQPSDNPLPSDTRTKSKPTPKGRESLMLGRESKERIPVLWVPRWGHAVGDLLQYSTRWCCILEITLPRGSLYVGCRLKDVANTHRLLLRNVAALFKESMDFPFCLFIAQELIQTMNL